MSTRRTRLARTFRTVDPASPDAWWTHFVFVHVFVVFVWAGVGLIVTDDIDHRHTRGGGVAPPSGPPPAPLSSLGIFHHVLPIPWGVWGGVFLAIAVGLLWSRTRAAAYLAGAFVAIVFTVAVVYYTYLSGNSTNPIIIPASTLAPDAMIAGLRYTRLPAPPRRRGQS